VTRPGNSHDFTCFHQLQLLHNLPLHFTNTSLRRLLPISTPTHNLTNLPTVFQRVVLPRNALKELYIRLPETIFTRGRYPRAKGSEPDNLLTYFPSSSTSHTKNQPTNLPAITNQTYLTNHTPHTTPTHHRLTQRFRLSQTSQLAF
jgi:hypothetical protein